MRLDLENPIQRDHLFQAIKYHWKVYRPFRRERKRLVEAFVGSRYGKENVEGCKDETFDHLLYQASQAMRLPISGGTPRYLITGRMPGTTFFALHFQTHLNRLCDEIHLRETFKACALDAFFGPSIVCVHLASAPMIRVYTDALGKTDEPEDVWIDPGQPYVSRVPPDDFVWDTSPTDFRFASFAGHRYRLPLDEVMDRFDVSGDQEAKIVASSRKMLDESDESAQQIARGERMDEGEYEPMVDLIDVYLRRDQRIVTFGVNSKMEPIDTDPLNEYEWDGLDTGPYHMLNLAPVPDNQIPVAPGSHLIPRHDLSNSLARKGSRAAKAQKTLFAVPETDNEFVQKAKGARHGSFLNMNNPGNIATIRLGGPDQATYIFKDNNDAKFDVAAGNMTARLGHGAQTETATQDQMISNRIAAVDTQKQESFASWSQEIGIHVAHLLFNDPVKEQQGSIQVPGTDFTVESDWSPEFRVGEFDDYEYAVEPYSLSYKSPTERAQILRQLVADAMPLYPLLQQQGLELDLAFYFQEMARLYDAPRWGEILKRVGMGPMDQGAQTNHQATQSPHTQRETIRRGAGGGGGQQQSQGQMNSMPAEQQSGVEMVA